MEVDEVVEPIPTHMFRVGWSLLNTGLQLGEYQHSFGYESSGRFVTNKQFTEYGAKFGVGDVIGSYLVGFHIFDKVLIIITVFITGHHS